MTTRVVALGQPLAGDDGVGHAIAEALRGAAGLEVVVAREASALVDLLDTPLPVVVVDAVLLPDRLGEVLDLAPDELEARGTVSSHGLGVREAIELARVLHGERCSPRVRLVAVGIGPPPPVAEGLSARVAAAVAPAADRVRAIARSLVASEER